MLPARAFSGVCAVALVAAHLVAQNPIVPAGVYIADPSAHVWPDGRLYVYGSLDQSPDYYCSWNYHVLSTSDLRRWTLHRDSFASRGAGDAVPYSDDPLYAPDCQRFGDTYNLYYCLANNSTTEGVATSKSPTGPFVAGRVIDLKGYNQIDPCVFVDEDGTAYYAWGQFSAKIARLKPGGMEIDPSSIRDGVLTEAEHHFHEGSFLIKRNGTYYFIFSDISRGGRPTCLGYATSSSSYGPYRYRGVIIDNNYCDPGNWNNHGSIVEFGGRWYVFYHRATHGSRTMRKACVEPIAFNEDGSITEVEMTSQGACGPLDAFASLDAARACLLYGNVRVQAVAADREVLGGIRDDDAVAYKYLDFGEGADCVTLEVTPGITGGRIDVTFDQSWHQPAAVIAVPAGGAGHQSVAVMGALEMVRGRHAVWLHFSGKGPDLFEVTSLQFHRSAPQGR